MASSIRTVGLAADLFQKMGLAVAQLPGGEILPAMDRGVIDAFEFNNPTSDSRFGAQDVAKNYMLGSYHQATEYFEIIVNKDKFNSLPAEHQAILEYAAEAASTANLAIGLDNYSRDLVELQTEHGVGVWRTPQIGPECPAQGLGRGPARPDGRPVLRQGGGEPEGLGRPGRVL